MPHLFSNKTGKYKGKPIPIQMPEDYYVDYKPERRIPFPYKETFFKEVGQMKEEDIIEGPLDFEEKGMMSIITWWQRRFLILI